MDKKFKFPDSGQKSSYDENGMSIYSPSSLSDLYGQDGDTRRNPQNLIKVNSNGDETPKSKNWDEGVRTVFDKNTGLYWEIKSPIKEDCNFFGNKYSWENSKSEYIEKLNSEKYGGFSDWRMPNKDELRSIVLYENINPAIDSSFFPNTQVASYWCQDEYKMKPAFGWILFLGFGSATAASKSSEQFVRAVRGGYNRQFGKADDSRFTDNNDGTVIDSVTGLIWQQGENERMNWFEALKTAKEMTLGGHKNWRVPNIKELNTILNLDYNDGWWYFKKQFPAEGLNPPLLHYFSSSEHEKTYAWVTNFCFGYDGYYANKMATLLFRAVCDPETTEREKGAFQLPESGQDECFNLAGEIIAPPSKDEPLFGQDGNIKGVPFSYTKLSEKNEKLSENSNWKDGVRVIKDNNTGLIWEMKSPVALDVNFSDDTYNWERAKTVYIERLNSEKYGGFDDWRLPNREELRSIVTYNGDSPAVNSDYFSNGLSTFYWSKDIYGSDLKMAWGIYFAYGCGISYSQKNEYSVRAVRGGYNRSFGESGQYQLVDNSDGTVSDMNSGLMWFQDELPDMSFEEATAYCKKMNFAGFEDWHIPTIRELGTILDVSYSDESWGDAKYFPNIKTTPLGFYWASTTFGSTFGWGINFQFGYDGYYADKVAGKYAFRPVRTVLKNGGIQ